MARKVLKNDSAELRRRAEERLGEDGGTEQPIETVEETLKLHHELLVQRVELEMQNTELREARDKLELVLEQYTDLYEFAPVSYLTLNHEGIITKVNLTAAGLVGLERSRLVGRSFGLLVTGKDRPVFAAFLERVFESPAKDACEVALLKEGNCELFVRIEAVTDASGQECRIILFDTTESILVRKSIREMGELTRETLRKIEKVADSAIQTVEEAAEEALRKVEGLEDAMVVARMKVEKASKVAHLKVIEAAEAARLKVEQSATALPLGGEAALEAIRTVEEAAKTARLKVEKAAGVAHRIVLAFTEKKHFEDINYFLELRITKAVEELRQKDQMLILQDRLSVMGEMINNIAHQWNQPLNQLGLVVQQLPMHEEFGTLTSEVLTENTKQAMQLIKFMSQTINDFRNLFKVDKNKITFGVNEVITRILSLIEKTLEDQSIGIAFRPEGDPMVSGFPNEYSQVLLNILLNARDALIEHKIDEGMISIHSFAEGERSVVTIADNAGGIPEEIKGKLFDAYFTTKGPEKGTGIGLFMSKAIIEKSMKGSLTVQNTREGAEFRIEI